PAVFDVQAPAEALAGTATPRTGVLGADAHFDLILNDVDVLHVTVPTHSNNQHRLPTVNGAGIGSDPIVHDAEFLLTVVRADQAAPSAWTTHVKRVTVRAAAAAALLGFAGAKSAAGSVTADTACPAGGYRLSADATFRLGFGTTAPADVTVF